MHAFFRQFFSFCLLGAAWSLLGACLEPAWSLLGAHLEIARYLRSAEHSRVLCEASVGNLDQINAERSGSLVSIIANPTVGQFGAERAKNWIELQGRDLPNCQTPI